MIVFDLDGTLVDSAREIALAMKHAWRVVVPDAPFPLERFIVGPPLPLMIENLSPDLRPAERDAIATEFRAHYDTSDFAETPPYDGMVELLDDLVLQGHPLAIATNKRRAPTVAILARWFPGRFHRVACIDGVIPDDGTRPETKAAMLEWLLRRFPPSVEERIVMVGDSVGDAVAARATSFRAVAVAWGYETADALAVARPDALVRTPTELREALVSLA